ncbi:MAG: hypothetical protein V3V20_05320, partial [Algisphaera sp.]
MRLDLVQFVFMLSEALFLRRSAMKVEMKRMKVWVCGVMLVGLLAGPALAQGVTQDTSRSRRRVRVVTPLAQVAHDRAHCDCRACWPNRRGWDVLTPRKRYGVRIPLRRVYRDTSAWPLRREVLGGGSAGGDMGVVRPLRADGSREMGVIRPLAPEQRIEPLPVDDAPVETFSEAPTATANDVPEKVSQDVFQKSQAALEPLVPGIDAGSLGTLSTQSYGVRPPTQGLSEDPWVLLNQGN